MTVAEHPDKHLVPWFPLVVFLLLSLGLTGTGLLVYRHQCQAFVRDLHGDLTTIAEFKVRLVSNWRQERVHAGAVLSENPILGRYVAELLAATPGPGAAATAATEQWLRALVTHYGYRDVILLDARDEVRLSVNPERTRLGEHARRLLAQARQLRQPVLSDLHTAPDVPEVHVDLAVPLLDRGAGGAEPSVVASLLIRLSPNRYLYPLLTEWPAPQKTAETLIVRRDGNDVLYLNELHHRRDTTLRLRLPADQADLPAAMAVRGVSGIVEGRDYRGVPVVAYLCAVPDSPWYMVSKVDQAEVLAPLTLLALRMFGTVALLILGAGGLLSFAWQRQHARLYRERYLAQRERQELLSRYQHLLTHANDVVLICDKQHRILDANRRAEDVYGYSREELLQLPIEAVVAPACRDRIEEWWDKAFSECGVIYESVHVRRDGSEFPVEVSLGGVKTDDTVWFQAFIRDIGARKEAERKLRESEQKYRDLVQNVNSAILRLDNVGRLLYVNPFAQRFLGHAHEELLGRGIADALLLQGTDADRIMTHVLGTGMAVDASPVIEIEHACKDGRRAWLAWTWQRIRDSSGRIYEVLGVGVDVTARRQAEDALLAERHLLRTLMDSMPDMIYVKDLQHRFVLVNSACLQTLGAATPEQAIGKSDYDFFPTAMAEQYWGAEEHLLRTGTPLLNREESIMDKAGRRRWVLSTKVALRDAAGNTTGLVGIGRDITDHKRLEQQFVQSQKMEVIGQLAGGVAHDFNNLLQAILGFSDILVNDMPEQDPRRGDLQEITKAAERASALTQKLLAFSRKQVIEPRIVDVNALVEGTEKMLRRLLGEEVALETILEKGLARVKVDPTQVEQIIMNLAVNARDAMPKGGRITIKTWPSELDAAAAALLPDARPGSYVCLSVSDTGIGMTREIMARLFEPFFSTKSPGKGTGLGLAVVYGIARQHEGWVTVQSKVGSGSVFTLYLPAFSVGDEGTGVAQAPRGPRMYGRGEHILLVEDDESARGLAVRVLNQNGYHVTVAADAEEAMELFNRENGRFDLVFTDVVLPDLNGLELVEQLRQRCPQLKVLMVSGYMDEKARQPLIREKQIRFLQKPYMPDALLSTVHDVLSSAVLKQPSAAGPSPRFPSPSSNT